MKNKTMTRKEVMKTKYKLNKELILKATYTSEEAYHVFQFNTAVAWIRYYILNDDDLVNKVLSHPMFKNWWLNQWHIRDEAFVVDCIEFFISDDDWTDYLKDAWLRLHQPERIRIVAPLSVLNDVLKQVANQIEKEVKHGS